MKKELTHCAVLTLTDIIEITKAMVKSGNQVIVLEGYTIGSANQISFEVDKACKKMIEEVSL